MAKGEKALLTCKPEFAYGAHGSPPKIPPDSTLNFEVELLRWQSSNDVSGDGGVIKKVLVEPSEMRGPGQNDEAQSEWRGGDWVCRARDSPPSSHSYSHLPHMMLSRVFHAPWIIDRPLNPHTYCRILISARSVCSHLQGPSGRQCRGGCRITRGRPGAHTLRAQARSPAWH